MRGRMQFNKAPRFLDNGASDITSYTRDGVAETTPYKAIGGPSGSQQQDEDHHDTLDYSLSGTNASSFEIDRTSGQITVGEGTTLDYETKRTYSVRVTATDPSNRSASITITINVTDVNEPPEILKKALVVVGDRSVGYAENGTGSVAEYTAAGPNTANLRWRLTGADASTSR